MSHFEQRLEADLGKIRDFVWNMGEDVQHALLNAKRALLTRDEELAYATVLGDNPINRASRACDRMCHTFIARHLPGAGHLREMAAIIRVNVALERMGDYAVTISRESLQLPEDLPELFILQIDALADDVLQILHDSRVAFRDDNAEGAKVLMQSAKRVEGKMDAIYDILFDDKREMGARAALTTFVVFNLLKRVADQAKNICDQTVYAVRGVAKIPRVYHFLFVDRPGSSAGQLAVAIGRKVYPTSATFSVADEAGGQGVSPALASFLEQTGLPAEDLATESLRRLESDFSDYDVIISLAGKTREHIAKIPFHTSALEWTLPEGDGSEGFDSLYRALRSEITALMDLLAGDEAA